MVQVMCVGLIFFSTVEIVWGIQAITPQHPYVEIE